MKKIQYLPRLITAILFFLLLIFFLILFFGRNYGDLRIKWLLTYFPDFYQHASNLSLSYILISSVGYTWLLVGTRVIYIAILCCFMVMVNFIYELWIPIFNSCDITDACYGSLGTLVAFVFLVWAKTFGLKLNPLFVAEYSRK